MTRPQHSPANDIRLQWAAGIAVAQNLYLLGVPILQTAAGPQRLERKTAAVLAYLALEGPTHKYKLAGMLWPDSGETAARNNMRQLLRRLRMMASGAVLGEDVIELGSALEVDVKQLSYLETPSLEALQQNLELLAELSYDDIPDFEEWLLSAREELAGLRSRATKDEAERLERLGNYREALAYAEVWVRLEPLSEEAYREVIRLHYLLGDRGAALAQFERLKQMLADELSTKPLPETVELIGLIERGTQLKQARPKPKETTLPTAILRPPVLAGREREWTQMEDAWQEGKTIFLSAEAGVGKTRLASDFLASKGSFVLLESRPGDTPIPYAANTRYLRTLLARYPDFQLPEWARQTLAAWMPELGEGLSPESLATPGGHNRLVEATQLIFKQVGQHGEGMLVDDLHYQDDPSMQMGAYLLSSAFPLGQPGNLRAYVACFRRDELSPAIHEGVERLVEADLAVRIELEALPTQAVKTLLEGLGVDQVEHLVPGLARYTGGNPLFILETLKHLIETNTLNQGLPSRLAPPGKVATLIGRRLQRLSPHALNLARAAAIAATSFNLTLATTVLERPAMELAEAHAELEQAQILRGSAFTHDLVYEATLAATPAAVKQVLHTNIARYLESKGASANPAVVAQHWEAAGDGDKTAEWLINAAKVASNMGLYAEELGLLERAIKAANSKVLRQEAQVMLADTLGPLGKVEESIGLAHQVLDEAEEPRFKQRALSVLQNMYQGTGRFEQAERYIDQGLELALQLGEDDRADGMRYAKGRIVRNLGRYGEAAEIFESVMPRYGNSPYVTERVQILSALGAAYSQMGQHQQARPLLQQAYDLTADLDSAGPPLRILAAAHLLYGLICQGEAEGFLEEAEAALGLGSYSIADQLRNHLALAYLRLRRKDEARSYYQLLAEKAFDPNLRCAAWASLAGLSDEAESSIHKAQELYPQAMIPTTRFTVIRAAILHGSVAQKSWAMEELKQLDPDTVPWLFQVEYQQLQTAVQKIK